ncbi:sodium:proton antiporter, partial [Veillonella atypica]|nr:sodium:proton antiporter [Veillonella atypica]
AKTSFVVMQIFLLIGWLIAMWQASGIIPMIIASGIEIINPNLFIICSFLITSCVSMLLGTSLGSVGTIGIVLITIAKAGNLPIDIVAGAIMAGAYLGDRNSP